MSVSRAFIIILASTFGFAALGAGVGYSLARLFPAYYRFVFRAGDSPSFDPVSIGVGLGLTQGLIAGLVVGCVVVLAVSLAGLRRPVKELNL